MKKLLTLLMFGMFLFSLVSAFSGSGAGTSGDPYQITSWAELNETNDDLTAYYVLTTNLDASDDGYSTYAGTSANGGQVGFP
jgi:hypothetical protein